jgi:hypothetical protein
MRQKGRGQTLQGLLIALLTLTVAAPAAAQVGSVDFQVIRLSGVRGSVVKYLAVRSQGDWIKFWERGSLEPTLAGDPPPATSAPRLPPPPIDFSRFILLIAETGVKPSSGYSNVFTSVDTLPASLVRTTSLGKFVTSVHIFEVGPGSCPRLTALMSSVSYALIPQTTNEIRFSVSHADSNCSAAPVTPPFIK